MGRFLARAWVLAVLLCWPWLGTSPAAAANVVLLLMDDAAASDVARHADRAPARARGRHLRRRLHSLADARAVPRRHPDRPLQPPQRGHAERRPAVRGERRPCPHLRLRPARRRRRHRARRKVRQRRAALDPGLALPRRPPGRRGRRRLLRRLRLRPADRRPRRSPTATLPATTRSTSSAASPCRTSGLCARRPLPHHAGRGGAAQPVDADPRYARAPGTPRARTPWWPSTTRSAAIVAQLKRAGGVR